MVRWYDYVDGMPKRKVDKKLDKRYKLECTYMKLLDLCDIIPLESILRTVHVIPDFNKDNRYFINNFI
jgi:hypothetical protein